MAPIASSSWCAQAGPAAGLFGAKITGGGSGGTVAVLAAAGERAVVDEIARRYQQETGRDATVFAGSSSGARAFGVHRLDPSTVRGAAAVVAAAALALGGAACRRGDREIRDGFTAAFDAPPVVAVAACPDEDAKLARLRPLLELAARSYQDQVRPRPLAPGEDVAATVKKGFDAPLPADLSADLLATEIRGLAVDYRCFLAQDDDRVLLMMAIADLFLRKGEALLAAGQIDAGYQYVVQGLSVYAQPRTYAFIHYLGAGYTLRRIQALLDRHPPPPAILDRLEETAAASLLSRAQLCAGIKVEFLAQAYVPFQDRLAPLRGRVAERWGERTVNAFAEIADRPRAGDVALWRTINDLYAPLIAGCLDAGEPPLAPLEQAARAKLAAVPDSATLKLMAATTLNRLSEFGELQDQFLVFMVDVGRRRLRGAGLPLDAATVKARLLVPAMRVPLTSAWDGSTATIADDPATPGGIIVTRGRLRQALPPLPRR